MGATVAVHHAAAEAVATHSCHMRHSSASKQPNGALAFTPAPRGLMNECPLVVGATAATSKNSSQLPDPGHIPVLALPHVEKRIEPVNTSLVVSYLPNRGPTHLRCCVFLI